MTDSRLQGFGIVGQSRVLPRRAGQSVLQFRHRAYPQTNLEPGADESNITALYGVGLLISLGEERYDGSAMQLRGSIGGRRDTDQRKRL